MVGGGWCHQHLFDTDLRAKHNDSITGRVTISHIGSEQLFENKEGFLISVKTGSSLLIKNEYNINFLNC